MANMSGALAGRPIKASHSGISNSKTPSLKYPASHLKGDDEVRLVEEGEG